MFKYLIIINFLTLFLYCFDKILASKHYYRVSEKILYLFSVLGGALGAILAMFIFKHKTLKLRFYFINFICLILWGWMLLWK